MFDSLREELERQRRHIEVLRTVADNQPIGIVTVANETGHPHHRVRQSLHILEEEEIIEPTPKGAVTTPTTTEFPATYNDRLDNLIDRTSQLKTDNPPAP